MSAPIQIATVAGRTSHYVEAGDATASKALILVHAFPVGVRLFGAQLAAFPDWRVIAPALPGFDGSDRVERPTVDEYARHLADFLDVLGIDKAVFCGVSMGGHVLFALLRRAADRLTGIVLADTRSAADTEEARAGRRRLLEVARTSGSRGIAAEMVPRLLGETSRGSRPEIVHLVREMIEAQMPDGLAAAAHALMSRPDSTPLLNDIRVPTLVVVGEEDTVTPPPEMERMGAAIPGAEFRRVAAAGHLANLENPLMFNALVATWLRRRFDSAPTAPSAAAEEAE
jgi:pimeloyl-ACP methyl ester carboxylesterase